MVLARSWELAAHVRMTTVKWRLTPRSRTRVLSDLLTHPVYDTYERYSQELLRATVRARDVERWVPGDGYPSYVPVPGLGWSGTGLRSA